MTRCAIATLACVLAACLSCAAPLSHAQQPQATPSRPSPPSGTPRGNPVPRVPAADDEEICRARHAAYQRSQACYARFRSFLSVRPEAQAECGPPLLDPSPECGPPAPYR